MFRVLGIYIDLQRAVLVCGTQSPRAFSLPPFYPGEAVPVGVYGLQPTGNPVPPYGVVTISGLLLTLSSVTGSTTTLIAESAQFTTTGDHLTGTLPIPTGCVPVGLQFIEGILAADFTVNGGTQHVESRCIIRNAAFPLPPGLTYDNFRGPAGQGVPTGGGTGQTLAKVSGADYDTGWQTFPNALALSQSTPGLITGPSGVTPASFASANGIDTIALRNAAIATEATNRTAAIVAASANPPFAVIAFTGSEGFGHGTQLTITQPDNGQGAAGGTLNATFFVEGTYDLFNYAGYGNNYPMPGTASYAQETIAFTGQPSDGDSIVCGPTNQTITFCIPGNPNSQSSPTCDIGATLNDTLINYAGAIGGATVAGGTLVKTSDTTGAGSLSELFSYGHPSDVSGCSVASESNADGAITSLGGADALAGYIASALNISNNFGNGNVYDQCVNSRGGAVSFSFNAVSDSASIALHVSSEGPAGRLFLTASGGQAAVDGGGPLYSVTNLAHPDGLPTGTNTGAYYGHADSNGNNTGSYGHADSRGQSRLSGSHAHAGNGNASGKSNIMEVTRFVLTTDATAEPVNFYDYADPYTFPSADALFQLALVVMGRRTNGSGVARWHKSVLVQVTSGAASILVQSDLETALNASGWACVVSVSGLTLNVTVNGATGSNITWTATFRESLCQ